MNQEKLFHESWENALHDTVVALGGYKKVAGDLWPGMKLDSAYAKLKACLNEEKESEKLTLSEIEAITRKGRVIGVDSSAYHFCASTGYDNPRPVNPIEKKTELMEQVVLTGEVLKGLFAQLERYKD